MTGITLRTTRHSTRRTRHRTAPDTTNLTTLSTIPIVQRVARIFRSSTTVPVELRQTFLHLYMDIFWYGILNGTTIAFLAVFATRQGATTQQIGLLSAVPALVNLVFALPAGSWLSRRDMGRMVFWTSIFQRMFYLVLIPLPLLLAPMSQVSVILWITLIMTIPGTVVTVGFNSMFGEVVPVEWRGYVVGIRNAALAIVTTVFTLISGALLDRVTFPLGYQIVFGMGVAGAALSSLHLYFLSGIVGKSRQQVARSAVLETPSERRLALEMRTLMQRGLETLRLDALKGHFARVMALLFGWHLFQYMAIPVFTPFVVNQLRLSDQMIGLAAALFNIQTFVGSLLLSKATSRFGNKLVTSCGIMTLCLYPILTSVGSTGYMVGNLIGGFAWAMAGGAIYNYILDNVPAHDRPAYLAWYSLISNAAILLGSMAGPALAGLIGPATALVVFGVGRFLAGAAITRWG